MADHVHGPECPALLAWDIPLACTCDRPPLRPARMVRDDAAEIATLRAVAGASPARVGAAPEIGA